MKFDKKILKKSLIILTIIMICVTIHRIVQTYALLETNKTGQLQPKIAKWNIELNETDITNGYTEDIVIDNFQLSQNNNVLAGKIAPGINGAVDLSLDPKDTDVSIRYDITLEDLGTQPIKISSIEMVEGTGTLVKTGENTMTFNTYGNRENQRFVPIRTILTCCWTSARRCGLRIFYIICKEDSISLNLATTASPTNIVIASAEPVLAYSSKAS